MVGRPEGLPVPIVQNPAGDLSGGAPQLIRLIYRPELYGGCPMEGLGRVPEKVAEDHPAGRLSRQLPPTPVMHSGLEPLLRQKPPSWSNS